MVCRKAQGVFITDMNVLVICPIQQCQLIYAFRSSIRFAGGKDKGSGKVPATDAAGIHGFELMGLVMQGIKGLAVIQIRVGMYHLAECIGNPACILSILFLDQELHPFHMS